MSFFFGFVGSSSMSATPEQRKQRAQSVAAWNAVDAHLKTYAPTRYAKLPPGYLDTIGPMPFLFDKIDVIARSFASTPSEYPQTFHGLMRVAAGLSWPEANVPALPDRHKRVIKCGATQFKRVAGMAQQVYVLLDHIKTRDPALWRAAMLGWNGMVSLNSNMPGVTTKRADVYGYVNPRNERIAGCIYVSPITSFEAQNKPLGIADLATVLHELAHLTAFAERRRTGQNPRPYEDPHDDPIWKQHLNAFYHFATNELGWQLAVVKDKTSPTGLRYGISCAACVAVG